MGLSENRKIFHPKKSIIRPKKVGKKLFCFGIIKIDIAKLVCQVAKIIDYLD